MSEPSFFVGYLAAPRDQRGFLVGVAVALIAAFAAMAFLLSLATDNPGDGGYGDDAVLSGVLETNPYPLLRLAPDAAHPAGHTVMLAGEGKIGARGPAAALAGQAVVARGNIVRRGDLDMLLVGAAGLEASSAGATPPPPRRLGRWRVKGEICDGKCYSGAMKPGAGLAHRACASLCVDGGVPPVFVSAMPVLGASFLLLAGRQGQAAPDLSGLIALPVTLEGELERRGDLLILEVDWARAREANR